jgi:beta-glucosidase-like glycosyl hydrolase
VAVRAVRAGVDIVLYGSGYEAGERAARALEARLGSRSLNRAAFERAAQRVLALRARRAG